MKLASILARTLLCCAISLIPPSFGDEYVALAKEAGDKAALTVVEGAGHFEIIAPGTQAWPTVEKAVVSLAKPATAR